MRKRSRNARKHGDLPAEHDLRPNKDSEAYKQLMYALEHPNYEDVTGLSDEKLMKRLVG